MKWENPPENRTKKGYSEAIRETVPILRQHIGQWALILESVNPGSVARWRMQYPDIEFRTRQANGRDVVDVYARARGEGWNAPTSQD